MAEHERRRPHLTTHEYQVIWRIEVEATSPREAAILACEMQRCDETEATVYDVRRVILRHGFTIELSSEEHVIDLAEPLEDSE